MLALQRPASGYTAAGSSTAACGFRQIQTPFLRRSRSASSTTASSSSMTSHAPIPPRTPSLRRRPTSTSDLGRGPGALSTPGVFAWFPLIAEVAVTPVLAEASSACGASVRWPAPERFPHRADLLGSGVGLAGGAVATYP